MESRSDYFEQEIWLSLSLQLLHILSLYLISLFDLIIWSHYLVSSDSWWPCVLSNNQFCEDDQTDPTWSNPLPYSIIFGSRNFIRWMLETIRWSIGTYQVTQSSNLGLYTVGTLYFWDFVSSIWYSMFCSIELQEERCIFLTRRTSTNRALLSNEWTWRQPNWELYPWIWKN